jgi:hypothetical protein
MGILLFILLVAIIGVTGVTLMLSHANTEGYNPNPGIRMCPCCEMPDNKCYCNAC